MDKKQVKSAISYVLKTAYFIAILSMVLFFFWKSPLFLGLSFASFVSALLIEALLFLLGFGLFSETKSVLIAAFVAFVFLQVIFLFTPSESPLQFIASCSMLPAYAPGDALLVFKEPLNTPVVKIDTPYSEGQSEIRFENQTFLVDGSLYFFCSHEGSSLCNEFIKRPDKFIERRGAITFQYGLCTRSDISTEPCVFSATIGNTTISALPAGEVIVFPGEYAGGAPGIRVAHRALFAINDSEGRLFYFTKGDNNPTFDSQIYNYDSSKAGAVVPLERIGGKVVLQLPFIGALSKNYNTSVTNKGCGSFYR